MTKNALKSKARILFRLAIALVFGYFGFQAVLNPEIQAAIWIPPWITSPIELIVPISIAMIVFGVIEIVVGVSLVVGKYMQYALPLAVVMLLGIIISVGFNELALRDVAIMFGALFLYADIIGDHSGAVT